MGDVRKKSFSLGVVFPDSDDDDEIFYTQYNSSSDETFYTPPISPVASEKEDLSFTLDDKNDNIFFSEEINDVIKVNSTNNLATNDQPPPKKCRFTSIVTENSIIKNISQNVPESTRNHNKWSFNVWKTWATWRNAVPDASLVNSTYKTVPLDPRDATEEEIGFWLSRFVNEVRNANGNPYPPNSLFNLLCGLQRYCNTRPDGLFRNMKFFDSDNPNFYKFYHSCDNVMRNLTAQGYGQEVSKASVITDDDEETLWSTGTINLNTPQGLSYGVYFYNIRSFGLRGGKIHRALEKDQFKIEFDLQFGVEKLKYFERISKSNLRGLKHLKVRPINPEILAQTDNPRCVVNLFKIYLSNIPDNGPFYVQPSRSKSNGFQPYQSVFELAKIYTSNRRITGHSGRATMCSKLFNKGFQESTVKERSGHRSKAVQSYLREDPTTRRGVSDVLQAKRPDTMPALRPL